MNVRHGHLSDLASVYEVCHRTGWSGQDASDVVSDRQLLGHYFAAPYLVHDPAWCWIAADDQGVAGYLVTTPDTRAFTDFMNKDWLPAVRGLYPVLENASWSSTEAWIRRTIHSPAGFPHFVDEYPAHLHIDFLPRAQGQGLGTRLLSTYVDALRASGVPGFHLGVGSGNTKALGFYAKQGFQVIDEQPGVIYLGLRL
jgi:ribosomal protein S18 acetylase RimI-like enzyme